MPRVSEHFGGPQILFKRDDLTGSVLSGNKIRKLEFSVAEALRLKADVIISAGGVQSNHCRATALVCAQLGLGCHLVLRGADETPAPDGNLLLDRIAGARISFYPRPVYSARKAEIVAELIEAYAREGKKAYYIPVGASNAIGTWGYVRAFEEILSGAAKQGIAIDHVVTAVGSGGTLAGLIAGKALAGASKPKVWGVNICDDAAYFETEIRLIIEEMNARFNLRMTPKQTPINMLDGYVGEGYAIPYPQVGETIGLCGRLGGLVLDPVYTGKAFYGLGEEIRKGRFGRKANVLFVHTGGVFGVFPQRKDIAPAL